MKNCKKSTFIITIIILYLLTLVCIIGTLGTMASLKYEVDENYWTVDDNTHLTSQQKLKEISNLDNKRQKLTIQAYSLALVAFARFFTATGLIIKQKKYALARQSGLDAGHNNGLF